MTKTKPKKYSPKIVVFCGSSRYVDIMAVAMWLVERDENAICMGLHLLPEWYCKVPDHLAEHEGVSDAMDELHMRKIDIADEIFVIDFDNYIGESCSREIEYAQLLGKPLRRYSSDPVGIRIAQIIVDYYKTQQYHP